MSVWKRAALAAAILALTSACSGDDGDDDASSSETCALSATFSGVDGVPRFAGNAPACTGMLSSGSGIGAGFLHLAEPEFVSLTLDVHDVLEGEVGTGFPATVEVTLEGGDSWQTPARSCSVDVTEHRYVGEDMFRVYQTAGSGTCPEPAEPVGGDAGSPLTIAPFSFRVQILWTG